MVHFGFCRGNCQSTNQVGQDLCFRSPRNRSRYLSCVNYGQEIGNAFSIYLNILLYLVFLLMLDASTKIEFMPHKLMNVL